MPKLTDSAPVTASPFADMAPGEVMSFTFRNGQTREIHRTARPFIYDWVDATNRAHYRELGGMIWIVGAGDLPQLVDRKYAAQVHAIR